MHNVCYIHLRHEGTVTAVGLWIPLDSVSVR